METGVFQRKMSKEHSDHLIEPLAYNLIIGLVLLWGFAINWLMVRYISTGSIQSIDFRIFIIGYFLLCLGGVTLFKQSRSPWLSFLGYNLVVVPFGLVINVVISGYDPSLVLDAFRVTAFVTLTMMALGSAFPQFFERIIGTLSLALLGVIIIELIEIFILGIHHDILDWIVVVIFCGYIGYDWGRANRIPKTMDNAVDSAAALYMDIINLFLRILRLLGRRKK